MKRRILALLLVLSMVVVWVPSSVFAAETTSGTCGENLTWTLKDGVLTISGTGSMYNWDAGHSWWHNNADVSTIVIEEGVTNIGACAFYGCKNLKKVYLGKDVTLIGQYAFCGCTNLTSILCGFNYDAWDNVEIRAGNDTIYNTTVTFNVLVTENDGTRGIAEDGIEWAIMQDGLLKLSGNGTMQDHVPAGSGWGSWVNKNIGYQWRDVISGVVIPSGIARIGNSAFANCCNITSVEIWNGVDEIGKWAFLGDTSLTTVIIPLSVDVIGMFAFYECTSLTDVYYGGSEAQWNQIEIGMNNEALTNATIHYNCDLSSSDKNDTVIDGSFTYLSSMKIDDKEVQFDYTYHYDESWFQQSSETYQHDLTKMSLRVAMAAGDIRSAYGCQEKNGYENLQTLMTDLGFSSQRFCYPHSVSQSDYDNIGYGLASKTIELDSGEKCTVILVAIRGSGYGAEWGGNFRMGASSEVATVVDHESFNIAAGQVLTGIVDYVDSIGDSMESRVKVWITGYSRAAATANLVAASLVDNSYTSIDGGFSKTSEYISGLDDDDIYAFCFECPQNTTSPLVSNERYSNIVNIVNPIDLVPKVAMSKWGFSRYGTTYYLPSAEASNSYKTQKAAMVQEYKKIIMSQSVMGDNNDQTELKEAISEHKGQASDFDEIVSNLSYVLKNRDNYARNYQSTIMDVVAKTMGGVDIEIDSSELTKLKSLLPDIYKMIGTELLSVGTLQQAHYMELCMAWLDSLDGVYKNDYSKYRRVLVNCPVDVEVRDSAGNIVASIIDNTVQEIENSVVAKLDSNGQKVVILPTDEEYTIRMNATADGNMTYTVTEYNADSGNTERVVSYHEVKLEQGDELHGEIQELDNVSYAEYSLFTADGEKETPTTDQTGNSVVTNTIEIVAETGGVVSGGGFFVSGEFAEVAATPEEGYNFIGWYLNNKKISGEKEYRFEVSGDMTLTAKFERVRSNPFTDLKNPSSYYDAVLWAVDKGITKGTSATEFSPKADCTRAQIVTFLWRYAGEPEPTTTKHKFVDIVEGSSYYKAVLWAVEKGITNGLDETHFGPKEPCTRAQIVTFLWRAAGKSEPSSQKHNFTDIVKGSSYYDAVLWAVEKGITTGADTTHFAPKDTCTRAQGMTFLWRYNNTK